MRKYRFDFCLCIHDAMLCKETNIARRNYLDSIIISSKRINDSKIYVTKTNVCMRISRETSAITNKFDSITSSIKNK